MTTHTEVRAQLRRILASSEFASSPRMQDFLRLAVNEALAGRGDRLKEYAIGVEVFRRPASFDPSIDPIVRVEARRLRTKLERYYAGEGRSDSVAIELPKGRYSATFRTRDSRERTDSRTARAIAVLPFQAVSGTSEARQFSEGLTWEITHRLTRIDGLSVMASESMSHLRDAPEAVSAGVALPVAHVLTGSVRQGGDRIRIIAQLVDTGSGVYVWSETYDRRLEDVLSIQDDIAQAIVSRLSLELGPQDEAPRRSGARYSSEAYQLYIRARASWNSRSEQGLRESLALFQEALEKEPSFALAWAGIADAYVLMAQFALEPLDIAMPAAKRAALRALELDPSLAEAHCSLAFQTGLYEWKWEESELHYRRALDHNPGYATAHHWYALDLLAVTGRFVEAGEELDLALQSDPLSPILAHSRANLLLLERRYEEALRQLHSLKPGFVKIHASLGRVLMQLGRYDEALSAFDAARKAEPGVTSVLGAMGQCLALSGRQEGARRILAELSELAASGRHAPSTRLALIHCGLGELDQALTHLERACETRELALAPIGVHPAYDALRGERRFQNVLRRMNLPQTLPMRGR